MNTLNSHVNPLSLILIQMDILQNSIDVNLRRVSDLIDTAPVPEQSLIVLPETFASGFMADLAECEAKRSVIENFLRQTAQTFASWVVGGLADRRGNQALLVEPDGVIRQSLYHKRHLFRPAGEETLYPAGQDTVCWTIPGWRITPSICYDLRFPEHFRASNTFGNELILCLANWPAVREKQWRALLQARAIENLAWVVGVNRCGKDGELCYPGATGVFAPDGENRVMAGDKPRRIDCMLDLAAVHRARSQLPALEQSSLASSFASDAIDT